MKIDGAPPRAWPDPEPAQARWQSDEPGRARPAALPPRDVQHFPGAAVNPYINWSDSRLAEELGRHFSAMETRYDR